MRVFEVGSYGTLYVTDLIDTQPFQILSHSEDQIRMALGKNPPSLMRKDFHTWRQEATRLPTP